MTGGGTTAGIDFDTHGVHVVLLPPSGPEYHELRVPGRTSFERLRAVRDHVPDRFWWEERLVDLVGIEDPRATNPLLRSVIGKLARVQGAVLQSIPRGVAVEPFNAKEWRVAVGLSGNASKEDVRAWAETNGFPRTLLAGLPQDAADAYAIARAAEALAFGRWARRPPKPRRKRAAT